jgi:hypothetical protein
MGPTDKRLGASLEAPPPAEELGQRRGCQPGRRDCCEEGEDRDALADFDVLRLLDEANVPAESGPFVLLAPPLPAEASVQESFCEPDELELRCGQESFRDVAVIESAAEAHVGRALRGHERMFPQQSRSKTTPGPHEQSI